MLSHRTRPPFLALPQEILDEILDLISLHKDLINLGLCSRACLELVVPRHSEYRVIRIKEGYKTQALWAHLAKRADLARNVREIHICDPENYYAPEHVPTDLVNTVGEVPPSQVVKLKNMKVALGHMKLLHTFTWDTGRMPLGINPADEASIMQVLAKKETLERLLLNAPFASRVPTIERDPQSLAYPLWGMSNLKSLALQNHIWSTPMLTAHLKAFFKLSPNLEYLDIPLDRPELAECRFPQLKSLRLMLQGATLPHVDKAWVGFMEDHPTIEELFWAPIGPVALSQKCLPALKRVSCNGHLLKALDNAPRELKELDLLIYDDPEALEGINMIAGASLRKLRIDNAGNTDIWPVLEAVAHIFPDLEYFWVTGCGFDEENRRLEEIFMEDWVEYLTAFPALEVFRGEHLWRAAGLNPNLMHELIRRLVDVCPNLRVLDGKPPSDTGMRQNKQIIIIREDGEDEEEQHIRYEIQRVGPSQLPFQFMKSLFP